MMSFIIYQIGFAIQSSQFTLMTLLASFALATGLYFIFRKGEEPTYELA